MGSSPTNSVLAVSYLVCLALSCFSPAVLLFSWLTLSYLVWNLTPVYPLWSYHNYYYLIYFHLCTLCGLLMVHFIGWGWRGSRWPGLYISVLCFYIIWSPPCQGAEEHETVKMTKCSETVKCSIHITSITFTIQLENANILKPGPGSE